LPFVCTWKAAGLDAAWVLLAGRLDLTTSPQLSVTVQDAQLHARVVVLDLRKLTFMDASGVDVVLNAACGARRDGGRVMLVRGPAHVDEMLTLTAASDEVLIVDLDPTEPAKELLDLGLRTSHPPYPDSGPGDVADQAAARGDAHRFRSLLTHSPIARLFGGAYR
jgi:anti-anti-sigma factor